MIAQTRQDPALRDLDGDLNLGLVLWASRPRREDGGAVMARHLGVGSVETGIVAIGVGDGGLEIIADHFGTPPRNLNRLICMPIQSGKPRCTTGKERRITRWEHEQVLEAVQKRLDKNPQAMRVRRETVEHPFGTLKMRMGATHFLMKRLPKVAPKWHCMCWPTTLPA